MQGLSKIEINYQRVAIGTLGILVIVYFSMLQASNAPLESITGGKNFNFNRHAPPRGSAAVSEKVTDSSTEQSLRSTSSSTTADTADDARVSKSAGRPSSSDPTLSRAAAATAAAIAAAADRSKAAAEMQPTINLRVLALGDSLTSGFTSGGRASHPYSLKLISSLHSRLPQYKVDVSVSAIPGDRVLGNMPARLRRNLTDASESKQPFKWVLIMGGINDMYGGQPAQAVFEALQAMYDSSVAAGASVLAMTCLPVETKAGFFSAGRLEEQPHLNQLIRSYAAGGPEQVYLLDFDKLLPAEWVDGSSSARYYDDGVHLTPEGYDAVGDVIAQRLADILTGSDKASAPSTAIRRLLGWSCSIGGTCH